MTTAKDRLAARARRHAARLLAADAASLLPQNELTEAQRTMLRADLVLLATLPRKLTSAAARIRYAQARRKAAARELATACQWVRGQVATQFRGVRWASLRQEFSSGMLIVAAKPSTCLAAGRQILRAHKKDEEWCSKYGSTARIRPSAIARMRRLVADLELDTIPGLRQARRDLLAQRDAAAKRVLAVRPCR